MTLGTLSLILVSVSLSALAQISFKLGVAGTASDAVTRDSIVATLGHALLTPGVLGGFALYGLGTLLWLSVLRRIDVSQAYPFIGAGIALTAILGYGLLGEALGLQRILGMLIVISRILIVAWS